MRERNELEVGAIVEKDAEYQMGPRLYPGCRLTEHKREISKIQSTEGI